MRTLRFRLRTLMAFVAGVALIIGGAIEIGNHQRWARSRSLERHCWDEAIARDLAAEVHRRHADDGLAKTAADMAIGVRRVAERSGRE
jgi:hypothetical protein